VEKAVTGAADHKRLGWKERLLLVADEGSFTELDRGLVSRNPINYPGYEEKIAALQKETGVREAIVSGRCVIGGEEALVGIMDSRFMMASMGSVVGEKVARLFEYGAEQKLPVVLFTASGGARMQEGTVALLQMAKTAGAARLHNMAGQFYLSVLCDPTTGGVEASFASLGDIIMAEPGATVGFAGKRVIRDTIGHSLPDHFQTAEFILEHGFADLLVPRSRLKETIARLLAFHRNAPAAKAPPKQRTEHFAGEAKTKSARLGAVQKLERLRNLNRPGAQDYLPLIFDELTELHGDRCFGDDPAVLGALAWLDGRPVTVIAQRRGKDVEELARTNFSMPHPEGYRKALRLARQAEKFHRPVLCLLDTPGAFCGVGAEERGQGEAIARCLEGFMGLSVPVLSAVLGEGGSGGALALAVCDELAMLENALYSVINPRGFASILWKDPAREKEAAELMKIGAEDLKAFGICDRIIDEGPISAEGESLDIEGSAARLKSWFIEALERLCAEDPAALPARRYARFRRIGVFAGE
jgi:acetyl-CoA carboxylase carboxyl transferase subunit beta